MKPDGIEKIHFEGKILGTAGRFTVTGSFRRNDFADLTLEVLWQGELDDRHRGVALFMANPMNFIRLKSAHPGEADLELLGLSGYGTDYHGRLPISTRPEFEAIQVGIDDRVFDRDRKFHVTVRMLPSGILSAGMHSQYWTGEIKVKKAAWTKPAKFTSSFGTLELAESFDWENAEEFGHDTLKRFPCTTVTGEITIPRGSSLYQANETLRNELDSLQTVLGFCFRQPVRYVHISYVTLEDRQYPKAYYRRKLSGTKEKLPGDPFIEQRNLARGGLDRLCRSLRQHPSSADLARAMEFLAASYPSTLETAFFMAFSALETVVNIAAGQAKETARGKRQREAWRIALEETVGNLAAKHRLDKDALLAKVREFERPTFRKRMETACARLKPVTDDLWPGEDYLKGMARSAAIRNGLFHGAKYSDEQGLLESLIRIRFLTERLVAKLLRWPDKRLWVHRDQTLRLFNRGSRQSLDSEKR